MLSTAQISSLVGQTPLRRLWDLEPRGVELWAKEEYQNLSGSIKARPAWQMMQDAEKAGFVEPGRTLLEPTSGNTGIALAMLARMRGMHFWAVLPENSTRERILLLQSLGARLTFSPAEESSNGAIRLAKELAEKEDVWVLDQYGNPANSLAHYKSTGPEIWQALPQIDVFVAGIGTGGTLMGTGAFLREQNPSIQIVGAEPLQGEKVQGLRSLEEGYIPPIFDSEKLDRKILVRAEDAVEGTRKLLRSGVLAGISSGANLHVALRVAEPGQKIVLVIADGWERYLSTGALESKEPDWSGWW